MKISMQYVRPTDLTFLQLVFQFCLIIMVVLHGSLYLTVPDTHGSYNKLSHLEVASLFPTWLCPVVGTCYGMAVLDPFALCDPNIYIFTGFFICLFVFLSTTP